MAARVAIVKSAGRADGFAQAVQELGLVPVLVSPFRAERIAEGERALAKALARRPRWVAVTSPQAVPALARYATSLASARLAAVGTGTAAALQSAGLRPVVVGESGGEALARRIVDAGLAPRDLIVHPCGESARGELSETLTAQGAEVAAIAVYRMVPDAVGERSAAGEFRAVVVGSPRLAQRAAQLFPSRPPVVAIGRTTAAALRDLGWAPAQVAATPTPEDVAGALRRLL